MDPLPFYDKYRVVNRRTGEEVMVPKFTLVPSRDRHARSALLAYAESCRAENPQLAIDLIELAGTCPD